MYFQEVQRNHHIFLDMVNNLKLERIYLENSIHFNIASIAAKLENVDVILMNFGCI